MLILIFYFSLINFLLVFLGGSYFGRFGSWLINLSGSLISFSIVTWYLFCLASNADNICHIKLGVWFKSGALIVNWGFLFDGLSIIMCFIILSISLLVQVYSYSYMFTDPSLPRFLSYLSLFTFFMLILVTADNFALLFLGWEGVGLCSFLLISFWNTRIPAVKAALKALLVNRVGDFCLLIAMALIFVEFRTLNFLSLFPLIPFFINSTWSFIFGFSFNFDLISLICFFLLLGCFGKSAQVGLHIWLPDAMEGPTPVSALIHAATMVTAGVFLVIRCSPLFEYAPYILNLMVFFGAFTAIFSALCGVVENDIKKVIAYSTCSQLGYMFFICGLSGYNVGLFHLFNHAFFKALLFLSAGVIIHSVSNEQNLMRMGALSGVLPFTFSSMFIGLLSLNAFPYTSGFYSKEVILSSAFVSFGSFGSFAYLFGVLGSFLTAFYSYRLFFYIFISENNFHKSVILNVQEENIILCIPLFILAFFSIFSGYLFKDLFIGFGSTFFDYSIFILPSNLKIVDAEFLPGYIKVIPLIFSFAGWGCINPVLVDGLLKFYFINVYNLLKNEWFFNTFYNVNLSYYYSYAFKFFYFQIDNILQLLGPRGISHLVSVASDNVSKFHSGYLYNYLCLTAFNLVIFMIILVLFF